MTSEVLSQLAVGNLDEPLTLDTGSIDAMCSNEMVRLVRPEDVSSSPIARTAGQWTAVDAGQLQTGWRQKAVVQFQISTYHVIIHFQRAPQDQYPLEFHHFNTTILTVLVASWPS